MIQCNHCSKEYMGETKRRLKDRFNEIRSERWLLLETIERPGLPALCFLGKMYKRPGLGLVCIKKRLVSSSSMILSRNMRSTYTSHIPVFGCQQ